MRNLKKWEINLLNEGNQYSFAHLVFELKIDQKDLIQKISRIFG